MLLLSATASQLSFHNHLVHSLLPLSPGLGGVAASAAAAAMGLPDDVWAGRWVEAGPAGTLLRHAAQPNLTEHGRPVYFVLVACRRRRYFSIIDGKTEFRLGQSIYNDEVGLLPTGARRIMSLVPLMSSHATCHPVPATSHRCRTCHSPLDPPQTYPPAPSSSSGRWLPGLGRRRRSAHRELWLCRASKGFAKGIAAGARGWLGLG